MKKFLIILLLVCFTSAGCTGSFNLTKKVYNAHRSQADKWSDELTFLVFILLPVYGISTFADAIVFNSIEFWTGENPVVLNSDPNKKFVNKDGSKAELGFNENKQVIITSQTARGNNPSIILEKTDSMVVAKDAQGNMMYASVKDGDGVRVYDHNLDLVKNFSAGEINKIKAQYSK